MKANRIVATDRSIALVGASPSNSLAERHAVLVVRNRLQHELVYCGRRLIHPVVMFVKETDNVSR